MKRRSLLAMILSLIICLGIAMPAWAAEENDDIDYVTEIAKLRQEEVEYQLQNYKQMNLLDQKAFLESINVQETSMAVDIENAIKELIDNAFVYYLTEDGRVFSEEGYVGSLNYDNCDLGNYNVEIENMQTDSERANIIVGQDSGAFIRQVSKTGYMGITSKVHLPTLYSIGMTTNYFKPENGSVPYIYNILSGNGFDMEGGVQFNILKLDYSPYIRVNGGALNFEDVNGDVPTRFKRNTTITHNLRYESTSKKAKYYINGTNIDGKMQYIVLGYAKSFSNAEINNLRSGRVTGLGYNGGYDGQLSLGTIIVQYYDTQLCKSSTSGNYNMIDLDSSLLDSWMENNKIFGTANFPPFNCNTSGSIVSQKHTIKF